MLSVGDFFPQFSLQANVGVQEGKEFAEIDNESFRGRWLVVFFWPKDFTFVCPTEILAFGRHYKDIKKEGAELLGVSVDSEYAHLQWRKDREDLRNLPFPMVSDISRDLSISLGILDRKAGVSQRATFIVDPDWVIRFAMVTDMDVGRNAEEVVRILRELKRGQLISAPDLSGKTHVVG